MEEYNNNGINFKYKKALDEADFEKIIKVYLDAYQNGKEEFKDEIEGTHFNPIVAEFILNRAIGELCIENFDDELNDVLFENGIYEHLKHTITNLDRAIEIINETKKRIDSVDEIINKFLNKIITIIPEEKQIKKLSKELEKAFQGHDKIIGKVKDGE